ncbi:MAG: hypothetical protein GC162_18215 [Planctomycetes bacterium]|nr:hypothetical protein [Planctomycetota bacterium]
MKAATLESVLRKTNAMVRGLDMLRAAGLVTAALMGAFLLAVAIDALMGLESWGLIGLDALLIATAGAATAYLMRSAMRHGYDRRRIARLVEERLGLADNRLINAIDMDAPDGATSEALRRMVIGEGEAAARVVKPGCVVNRRPMKRAMLAANGSVAGMLVLIMLAPRVFSTVLPRLMNPTADLPPFTLVQFDVATGPEHIYYGHPASITAKLGGPLVPDQASVVFVDGDKRTRAAMLRRDKNVFVLPIDRATNSQVFFVDTPEGRSGKYELKVLPTPIVEKATVTLAYPLYTTWPTTTQALGEAGIKALVGTRATLTLWANLPLREGSLTLRAAAGEVNLTLLPTPGDPTTVSGSFEITHDGSYTIALTGADGAPGEGTLTGVIKAVPDAPPTVQLMEPDLRLVAPVGWKVPVKIGASDDVAIDRVMVQARLGDREPVIEAMAIERRGPTYATGASSLDLDELDAAAGDVIYGFGTAFDNFPPTPHSTDTPIFEIHVISKAEYEERARQEVRADEVLKELEGLMSQMRRIEAMRDTLIKDMETLKKKIDAQGGKPTEEDKKQLEAIGNRLEDYKKQSEELAKRMAERAKQDPLYDFEKPVQEELRQRSEQLAQQAATTPDASDLDRAIRQLKQHRQMEDAQREQHERTAAEMEKLRLADAMMGQSERIMSIAERQRELAEKLAAFSETDEPTPAQQLRMYELSEDQRALRQELTDAVDKLEAAAKASVTKLPKMSDSAIDIVMTIRDLDIAGDQKNAEEHAAFGQGFVASLAADSAAKKLESLLSDCKSMSQCQSDDLDGALNMSRSALGQCLSQMARARQGRSSGKGSGSGANGQGGTTAGSSASTTGGNGEPRLVGPYTNPNSTRPGAKKLNDTRSFNEVGRSTTTQAAGEGPEKFDPDARTLERTTNAATSGVPAPYRQLAEDYFRRLAEDHP